MGAFFARYALNIAAEPSHAASGFSFMLSLMPGLSMVGMRYTASEISGFVVPPLSHHGNAVPERSHAATMRSGIIVCMRLTQYAPPEWPHRHHGAVFNSAWPDFSAKSSSARRKIFADPFRGSIHSSQPSRPCFVCV